MRVLAAAVAAFAGLVGALIAAPAHAADEDVRWSVTPATASGPDDRVSIQHELDPGASIVDHIAVRNLSGSEQTFRLSAADGFTTVGGKFDMLPTGEESVDAGTWISIPDEVTVGAGETAAVPFEITVPERAEPGDHPAGIAASFTTTQSAGDGTSLGVESRVGVKVITRVAGEVTPVLTVGEAAVEYHGSWNPFRPGSASGAVTISNDGNVRLSVTGVASIGTGEAAVPADGARIELLPGDTREVAYDVDGVWPTVWATGSIEVIPVATTMDGAETAAPAVSADVHTWAIPWAQLLLLLALALIVIAATWNRRRGRRRLQTMLQQAREEGRRSAAPGTPGTLACAGLGAIALTAMLLSAPGAAVAAADSEISDDVAVHVTITELDDSGTDGDQGEDPDDDRGNNGHGNSGNNGNNGHGNSGNNGNSGHGNSGNNGNSGHGNNGNNGNNGHGQGDHGPGGNGSGHEPDRSAGAVPTAALAFAGTGVVAVGLFALWLVVIR
ncbi:WxL protein peptidoglycan domain-containing protein [Microbacterium halophytorum]|uniref:WxL protein peptidoglycan domain-containing protein n=1 Tax=Microbacterium halophytorum TaxID=2067568 RepID=UPI00131A039D|nr:DUF916 domain-containing protein [Microbacterium halophytorum]